jgi:hypothetical protein
MVTAVRKNLFVKTGLLLETMIYTPLTVIFGPKKT